MKQAMKHKIATQKAIAEAEAWRPGSKRSTQMRRALEVREKDPELFAAVKEIGYALQAAVRALRDKELRARMVNREQIKRKITPVKPVLMWETDTPRKQQWAASQKSKMIKILTMINGLCTPLPRIRLHWVAADCTDQEILEWVRFADHCAKQLRVFSNTLMAQHGGKHDSASSSSGEADNVAESSHETGESQGRFPGDSPQGTAGDSSIAACKT